MSDNRVSNSIMTFVVGLGIGALLGILFAPKSGEETRQYLSGGARDAVNTVVNTVADAGQKIAQNTKQSVTDTADQIRDAVLEGERAYTQAKSA